jgi:hypothetical protein
MSLDGFKYAGYKDRVKVEKEKANNHWTRRESVTGKAEDVMLYVADRLNEKTTICYEHMAWRIVKTEIESEIGEIPTYTVHLYKSDYAGD